VLDIGGDIDYLADVVGPIRDEDTLIGGILQRRHQIGSVVRFDHVIIGPLTTAPGRKGHIGRFPEIDPGYIPDRPEAGAIPENPDIGDAVAGKITGDRLIGWISEVNPGYVPDRPEAGRGTEDGDIVPGISVEVGGCDSGSGDQGDQSGDSHGCG